MISNEKFLLLLVTIPWETGVKFLTVGLTFMKTQGPHMSMKRCKRLNSENEVQNVIKFLV